MTIRALDHRVEPYREALAELAAIDAEASNLEAQIAALRETIAADRICPSSRGWTERTSNTTGARGIAGA